MSPAQSRAKDPFCITDEVQQDQLVGEVLMRDALYPQNRSTRDTVHLPWY